MKEGDDGCNAQDFDAMKAAHHADMIAHVTGNAEPIRGRDAHAVAMASMFRMFPDGNVIPGTGKSFDLTFSTTARWEGGLLAEEWASFDVAVMAQQIGLA